MISSTNPMPSTKKRYYLRVISLFVVLSIMGTAFAVLGNTYTNDEQEPYFYYCVYDYMNQAYSYLHGEDYKEEYCHNLDDYTQIYDGHEIYSEVDYPYYSFEWMYETDFYSDNNYIGITPFANWGGPYPIPNFHITLMSPPSGPWPAPAGTSIIMSVPESDTGASLSGRFPQNRPGMPIRAGFNLQAFSGSRHMGPGGAIGGMNPSRVPNASNAAGLAPTTAWRAINAPNITHYPFYIALSSQPGASGTMNANFVPHQLGMPDINLNNDNHLAIALPTPTPLIHYTRAVVGEYTTADFATYSRVTTFNILTVAPTQFKLQTNNVFEFLPTTSVTGTISHVTTGFMNPAPLPNHANIQMVPVSDLGVGTHIDTIRAYQSGYVYCYSGSCGDDNCSAVGFYFHWHDALALEDVQYHPAQVFLPLRRTQFTATFVIMRPATAVDISSAVTATRAATVHVGYEYRNPTPSPDSYNYNNLSPGFTAVPCTTNIGDHIITIPPPRYTFFDYVTGDALRNVVYRDVCPTDPRVRLSTDQLPINIPAGYAIVSARVDDAGNLVVIITPFTAIPDWTRLNYAINIHNDRANLHTILIHPAGTTLTGMTAFGPDFIDLPNGTYHLIITDPNPNAGYLGYTITTLPITEGPRPPTVGGIQPHPHGIFIPPNRNVTIQAAYDYTIYLRMNMASSLNTTNDAPWGTPPTPALNRHFVVGGGGVLTFGGQDTGNLVVDGNVNAFSWPVPVPLDMYRGGIHVMSQGTLNIHAGTTIMNNSAAEGGGVSAVSQGTVRMTGGTIGADRVGLPTGGVNPYGNRARRFGGGISLNAGASLYMNNYSNAIAGTGRIVGNHAQGVELGESARGGGVFLWGVGTTFNMEAGSIERNFAQWGGGGVVVDGGARFYMTAPVGGGQGGLIHENASLTFGGGGVLIMGEVDGAVIRRSELNMSGGRITNNSALVDSAGGGVLLVRGGRFNMLAPDDAENPHRIAYNRVYSSLPNQGGGGVEIWYELVEGTEMNMHGGIIERNYARHGGGIYLEGGTLNMTGGSVRYNRFDTNNAPIRYGGGIKLGNISAAEFNMSGGAIYNNRAHYGGGLRMSAEANYDVDFNMSGGAIRGNEAIRAGNVGGDGGGVWMSHANSTFAMTGGTIGGARPIGLPEALPNPYANTSINGGGVWVGNNARFYMQDYTPASGGGPITGTGRIDSNLTGNNGGGVFVGSGSVFNLRSGSIHNNVTTDTTQIATGGGGVYVANANFYMTGGLIYYNSNGISRIQSTPDNLPFNTNRGGGVHVAAGGFFEMDGGVIRNNNTRGMGAGINVSNNGIFIMLDGRIRNNWARSGGGVYMEGSAGSVGTFEMHGGYIYNNLAIGRYDAGGNWLNGVGGGVRLLQHANMTMYGGVIRDNDARLGGGIANGTATTLIIHPGSIIRFNDAIGADGGGIRLTSGATGTMLGGVIYGNTAYTIGGGVMLHSDSTFNMDGGTIGAARPAGLPAASPNPYANTAVHGGGVYVDDDAIFNLRGGNTAKTIIGNEAEYDGGGVYVASDGEMLMQTTAPVATNVHITHNRAGRMGGGIFTEDHGNYPNILPYVTATGRAEYFQNIILHSSTTFSNNAAGSLATPPANVSPVQVPGTLLQNIGFASTTPSLPHLGYHHPLNNHDINFRNNNLSFSFIKVDEVSDVRLPGVVFNLYRRGDWCPIEDEYLWNLVATDTSSSVAPIGEVRFTLTPNGIYRMREVSVPDPKFVLPQGYWTIPIVSGIAQTPIRSNTTMPNFFMGVPFGGLAGDLPYGVYHYGGYVSYYEHDTLHDASYENYVADSSRYDGYVEYHGYNTNIGGAPSYVEIDPLSTVLMLRNIRYIPFDFLKTDEGIYRTTPVISLLPFAEFMVFRAPADAVPAATGLVTDTTTPNAPWQAVPAGNIFNMESTLNYDDPISFRMNPAYVYQLVETVVPVGFRPPGGQWQLRVVSGAVTVDIIPYGAFSTPGFENIPCNCPDAGTDDCNRPTSRLLGNLPDFDLPMSGGLGTPITFAIAGTMFIVVAAVGAFAIKQHRSRLAYANHTKGGAGHGNVSSGANIHFKKIRKPWYKPWS